MKGTLEIKHNESGTTHEQEYDWPEDIGEYLWDEGNNACDCNRHLFFMRAIGNEPDGDEIIPCGDKLYSARFTCDGIVIYADGKFEDGTIT